MYIYIYIYVYIYMYVYIEYMSKYTSWVVSCWGSHEVSRNWSRDPPEFLLDPSWQVRVRFRFETADLLLPGLDDQNGMGKSMVKLTLDQTEVFLMGNLSIVNHVFFCRKVFVDLGVVVCMKIVPRIGWTSTEHRWNPEINPWGCPSLARHPRHWFIQE